MLAFNFIHFKNIYFYIDIDILSVLFVVFLDHWLIYSHTSYWEWEKLWAKKMSWFWTVLPWGGVMWAQLTVPLTISVHPHFFFFLQQYIGTFARKTQSSTEALSSMSGGLNQSFPKEGLRSGYGLQMGQSQFAYRSMLRWAELPYPLVPGCWWYNSHKGTSVHGWMQNCC